jgi:integrase/recombinase XerD
MSLHEVVEGYIAFKRALGVRLESEARVLRAFSRSMGDTDIEDVKPAAVLAFVAGAGPVTRTWKQKASVLRSFYRYAVGRGHAPSSPVPTTIPKFPPTRAPHIYSTDELKRLLAATEMLDTPQAPLRALAYRTLLCLLYGTGMRLNEALSLTLNDVDLADRLITVRNAKFFKTRWVPTGPKLTSALADYARQRVRRLPMPAGRDSAFFGTARSGTRWHWVVAEELFRHLRKRAGVCREGDARNQPRLHDVRHTAAQHRLVTWYRSGQDVQRLLPQLATYLGHVDLSSTQYYIAMTPELLHEANLRFERYAQPENFHA